VINRHEVFWKTDTYSGGLDIKILGLGCLSFLRIFAEGEGTGGLNMVGTYHI
jgi:hypothetical protein